MLTDSEDKEFDELAFRVVADLPMNGRDTYRYLELKRRAFEGPLYGGYDRR